MQFEAFEIKGKKKAALLFAVGSRQGAHWEFIVKQIEPFLNINDKHIL